MSSLSMLPQEPIYRVSYFQLVFQPRLHCTSHGHCSITRVFHGWKSAILHANSTRKTRVKHWCKRPRKNTRENTRKLGKFACKTLYAHCNNLRVFGLLEFLHRSLRECSCTCAVSFVSKNQTFEAVVQMLVFYVICAKRNPSFLTERILFFTM